MKTYKTWEVMRKLAENPDLRFKTEDKETDTELTISVDEYGYLNVEGKRCCDGADGNINLNHDWNIVQQKIEFIEAMKKHENGEAVCCKLKGKTFIYRESELIDQHGSTISGTEILNGEWFATEERCD